jgi:hypothetical protein
MKTVLEELEKDILKLMESKCYINPNNVARDIIDLINFYKEEEKYHLIRAHDKGIQRFCYHDPERHGNEIPKGEQYYKDEYKNVLI